MKQFYAGGLFYNPETHSVLLQKRDGNTKFYPHKWSFFGGASEGDETPEETFIREIKEELNVQLEPERVIPLRNYLNKETQTQRWVFVTESTLEKSQMQLGEGEDFDWVPLSEVFKYDLTWHAKEDLEYFLQTLSK